MGKFKSKDHKDKQPDNTDFKPVPAGTYTIALVKAERKASQNAGNYYMNSQFTIVKGEHKKRVIFNICNLTNSSGTAQDIAEGFLSSFMDAAGVDELKDKWDWSKLLNMPVIAKVKIRKDDEYGDKNEITGFIVGKAGTDSSDTPWEEEGKKKGKKDKKKKKGKKKGKKTKDSDVPF